MSNAAKSKEQLMNAPKEVIKAMENYVTYGRAASEMHNDICEHFNSPMLWAAFTKWEEHVRDREKAWATMSANGYTLDDAFRYDTYANAEAAAHD
jgi:hypothetical protein